MPSAMSTKFDYVHSNRAPVLIKFQWLARPIENFLLQDTHIPFPLKCNRDGYFFNL